MKYGIVLASIVGLGVVGLGCSSIPGDLSDAARVADSVSEQRERSQQKREQQEPDDTQQGTPPAQQDSEADVAEGPSEIELTHQEQELITSVEFFVQQCPLEGAPYHEDASPYNMRHAISQCETSQPGLEEQLASLGPERLSHPELKQAYEDIQALGGQIEFWRQEIAEREVERVEDRETYQAYQSFLNGEQTSLVRVLFDVREGTIPGEHNIFMPKHRIGERVEVGQTLEGMGEECQERFDNDRSFHNYASNTPEHPKNTCDIIQNWEGYLAQYINLHAAHTADELSTEMSRRIDVLEESGYTMDSHREELADMEAVRADLEAFYGEHLQALDEELSDEAQTSLASITEQQDRFEEVFSGLVSKNRWESSNRRESEVRSALDRLFSGTDHRIRDYSVDDVDWNIERTREGAPVARYHQGGVVTQRSGENFCRIYNFRAVGQYDGTGYTQARIAMNIDTQRYILTACP